MVDWVGIGLKGTIKQHLYRQAVLTAEEGTSYRGECTVEQIQYCVTPGLPIHVPATGNISGACLFLLYIIILKELVMADYVILNINISNLPHPSLL